MIQRVLLALGVAVFFHEADPGVCQTVRHGGDTMAVRLMLPPALPLQQMSLRPSYRSLTGRLDHVTADSVYLRDSGGRVTGMALTDIRKAERRTGAPARVFNGAFIGAFTLGLAGFTAESYNSTLFGGEEKINALTVAGMTAFGAFIGGMIAHQQSGPAWQDLDTDVLRRTGRLEPLMRTTLQSGRYDRIRYGMIAAAGVAGPWHWERNGDAQPDIAFQFRLHVTAPSLPSWSFEAGVLGDTWADNSAREIETIALLGMTNYHMGPHHWLFVSGGPGAYWTKILDLDGVSRTNTSAGLHLGVGVEIPVSRHTAIVLDLFRRHFVFAEDDDTQHWNSGIGIKFWLN
jgi:hypothetical protein